ncbi:unnamed protein product, partial [marine sediment metagenome]
GGGKGGKVLTTCPPLPVGVFITQGSHLDRYQVTTVPTGLKPALITIFVLL